MWPAPGIGHWRWNLRLISRPAAASDSGTACTDIFFALASAPPILSAGSRGPVGITTNPRKNMNTKPPECWANDPQARGLRIEISPEHTLVLPFDQFVFSELETHEKEQRLKLTFATHEVVVRGVSLRRIETAMQRMELSHLALIPARYRPTMEAGQPMVCEIVVTESKTKAGG
jgi:hypothetical protein